MKNKKKRNAEVLNNALFKIQSKESKESKIRETEENGKIIYTRIHFHLTT